MSPKVRIALACAVFLGPAPLRAESVGSAVSVTPAAQTESPRGAVILAHGGQVNAFDKVRTSVDGAVTLKFKDNSTLDVGPGSVVTIDRFVYNPDNTARTAAITMTKGTFRWVSGRSAKEAYDIRTPATTLGIRGTDFTVIADLASTVVELKSGAVRACSPVSGRCSEINRAGQGVRVWNDGRIEGFAPGSLLHGQVRRMAHHMRMPGLHRPPVQGGIAGPTVGQSAAQTNPSGPLAARQTRAIAGQWSGSFAPRAGLESVPKNPNLMSPVGGTTPVAVQNAALVRDHRLQMTKPIQGGMMPGGARSGPSMLNHRIQQPGLVERKGATNLQVVR